jgi:bifunctional non-homologous end joining protein LigD
MQRLSTSPGGIQYVEHAEGHGDKLFAAVCKLGLEGIVSKKLDTPYRSGRREPGPSGRAVCIGFLPIICRRW